MKKTISKKAIGIIALCLAGTILLVWFGERFYSSYLKYRWMEIYEVAALDPVTEKDGTYVLEVFYMLCDPPNEEAALKEKVDTFLVEKDIVASLRKRYRLDKYKAPVRICCVFIQPTRDWPIGKISQDTKRFDIWTGMTVALVHFRDGGTHYHFYMENIGPFPSEKYVDVTIPTYAKFPFHFC